MSEFGEQSDYSEHTVADDFHVDDYLTSSSDNVAAQDYVTHLKKVLNNPADKVLRGLQSKLNVKEWVSGSELSKRSQEAWAEQVFSIHTDGAEFKRALMNLSQKTSQNGLLLNIGLYTAWYGLLRAVV